MEAPRIALGSRDASDKDIYMRSLLCSLTGKPARLTQQ